jgi:ribosomal protein L36
MNRTSQLASLILSFYREEPEELRKLSLLRTCKVFRRWGVLYIRCQNRETAAKLRDRCCAIAEPVAKLRLAKKITILVNKHSFAEFPVDIKRISA